MRTITIAQADPGWAHEFLKIKAMISGYIGDQIIGIEHVGSTSVPGLGAKPIIDIDVVIEDMTYLPAIIERLGHAGFHHEGNLGIEGREAFKRRFNDEFMPYHLYVCPKDGKGYLEHIAFRDYLRSHPDTAREYERLKQKLARLYPHDIDGYLNGKNGFIKGVLAEMLNDNDPHC
ncbi:MAG: GrpB family protein [Methanospirillum sp.]|uniref:GrpB family protein n=1 Tax=Methanospirillum sp. TaxID=45200 RepID=UPI00236B9AAD|nr:GrpB family protein [Methanospirillum sp.]MDD1728217.1 GrpB family protein [Methanospirillum sp.]